jgi:hypothetical protein
VPLSVVYNDPRVPGVALVGESAALRAEVKAQLEGDEGMLTDVSMHLQGQAQMLSECCVAAFKALYLISAQNIEIADAQVPRQQRRQVERRGGDIAKVVRIRRATKQPAKKKGDGPKREFSHRFPRRGHYAHYTTGPLAKPDHISECHRRDPKTGELTCPNGCRRVWHPDSVVGDESLPYVPKTYLAPTKDHFMSDEGEAA